jgi:hypothetical protein
LKLEVAENGVGLGRKRHSTVEYFVRVDAKGRPEYADLSPLTHMRVSYALLSCKGYILETDFSAWLLVLWMVCASFPRKNLGKSSLGMLALP